MTQVQQVSVLNAFNKGKAVQEELFFLSPVYLKTWPLSYKRLDDTNRDLFVSTWWIQPPLPLFNLRFWSPPTSKGGVCGSSAAPCLCGSGCVKFGGFFFFLEPFSLKNSSWRLWKRSLACTAAVRVKQNRKVVVRAKQVTGLHLVMESFF